MTRYIALLRGINVGGHTVKMEKLRTLFEELQLRNVRSYINSGNVFFDTDDHDKQKLAHGIERHLHAALGFEVPTFLRTPTELESILAQEPFKGIELANNKRFSVVFTNEPINTHVALPQHSSKNDIDLVAVNTYEAFVVWHIINDRPPSGKFAKGVIPSENTSRFYHTLAKILNAARA